MISRYPHKIQLFEKIVSVKDSDGNVSELPNPGMFETIARVKIGNAVGNTIQIDGDNLPFSHTISLPKTEINYSGGTVVWQNRTYIILRFRIYQERSKIWI